MPDPSNDEPSRRRHVQAWPWLAVMLALVSSSAWAAVKVPTPRGWSADANASRAALAEAEAWAAATGLEASQIASPDESDGFVENLVVLVDRRPLHPDVLAHEPTARAALTELADEIFDASSEPVVHELIDVEGAVVERARWNVSGTTWDLLLVPAGSEHAVVVLKTLTADQSLHGDLMAEVVDGLEGVSTPIQPFPVVTWRWSLLVSMLLTAAIVHVVALRRNHVDGDHLVASRRSSVAVALLSICGTGVAYLVLDSRGPALALAGTSTQGIALELLGAGIVAALGLMILGRVLGGRPERVESAPRTGIYSADGAPSSSPGATAARPHANPVPRPLGPDADADVADLPRGGSQPQSPERPRGR